MTILEEAAVVINGPRREAYGPLKESYGRIAAMWSVLLRTPVTAAQVAQCMIALKLVRESHSHSRDNAVDICGYAAPLEELNQPETKT